MSEYRIQIDRVSPQVQNLQSCRRDIAAVASDVRSIAVNLCIQSASRQMLSAKLLLIAGEIEDRAHSLAQCSTALSEIANLYEQADQNGTDIADGREDTPVDGRKGEAPVSSGAVTVREKKEENSGEDGWWNSFLDHFWDDFLSNMVEKGGMLVVTLSGYYNYLHAFVHGPAGPNSFVILNPAIASQASKYAGIGRWLSGAGKYGLPVIGGVIEYVMLRQGGKDVREALIKAGAHTGIGFASGAAGAAIGSAFGSVIPIGGTIAGGVIGFVAGVVIATTSDGAFDYVYDNWNTVTDHVREAGEWISSVGEDISQGVQSAWNTVVDFNRSIGRSIGTAFGW